MREGGKRSPSSTDSTNRDSWKALRDKELKGSNRSLEFETPEGIVVKPVYGASDLTSPLLAPEELPGLYPFRYFSFLNLSTGP